MESLKISFEAVAPIFLMMLIGYLAKKSNLADKKVFDGINKLVFKIFLPVLLFYNVYTTEIARVFEVKAAVFSVVATIVVVAVGLPLVFLLTDTSAKRGVMLQGFFRSNFAILGIPLIKYICGEGSGGFSSLMVAIIIPAFNVLAVISLEIFRGSGINIKSILKGIVTNPLIIGCFLGVLTLLFEIKLPFVIEKTVSDISKIASPLAIVVLGASFEFPDIRGYLKENIIVILARLVIVPLIMLSIAAKLGITGEPFACLMLVFGSPVAVSSFAMAQQMGGDEKLASQVIVLTSALCIVTLFVWIFIFSSMGII